MIYCPVCQAMDANPAWMALLCVACREKREAPLVEAIAPKDIDATRHLWGAFGECEMEVAAGWLVRLAQARGDWGDFTWADITAFYREKYPCARFDFHGLIGGGFIVSGRERGFRDFRPDTAFRFTAEFIGRCYRSSERTKRPGGWTAHDQKAVGSA